MTHDGVKKLFRVMMSCYPNFKPTSLGDSIEVWETILKDYSDEQIALALNAYIRTDTRGFAPAIGQIIELVQSDREEMGELEAWTIVRKAICNGTYGAEKEFAKLPEVIQTAIGDPGQLRAWAQMSIDSVESVAQSNFMRSYRASVEREKKERRINPGRMIERKQYTFIEEKEERTEGIPMPEGAKERLRTWKNSSR